MKTATPLLRKHSLSIALLAAIGFSSSAVIAQDPVGQPSPPPANPEARAAAQAHTDAEMDARQQGAPQRSEQQHQASQQHRAQQQHQAQQHQAQQQRQAMQHQAMQQQASPTSEPADRFITGQAVVVGEDGTPAVVRSRPNLLPRDQATGMTGMAGVTGGTGAGGTGGTDDYAVSGDSSINFGDLDEDGDGFISREEAQADPNLSEQFNTADRDNDGMLSPAELDDWSRR